MFIILYVAYSNDSEQVTCYNCSKVLDVIGGSVPAALIVVTISKEYD